MNRGLRPVLDSIRFDGCPFCGDHPVGMQVNGPDEIRLSCGHAVDAKERADEQFNQQKT